MTTDQVIMEMPLSHRIAPTLYADSTHSGRTQHMHVADQSSQVGTSGGLRGRMGRGVTLSNFDMA